MSLTVSVVICAYTEQRWDDVLAAVASAREQSLAPHELIVVVDHNPDLRARLAQALPDITVIENREARGLSGGKNTGIAAATGEVVAFLDDDAVAGPDWLRTFSQGYSDPDVYGVGGLTLPWWATERPRWFPEEFDWVVGCTFTGREPGPVRNLLGGNASFRREAFTVAGGFPTHIGRTSARARPLGCEETEFCIRLARRRPGVRFVYDSRAVIWHRVPADRQGFRYFRSRCYAEGLSKALVTRSVGMTNGLSDERRYATATLGRGVARGVVAAWRGDRSGLRRSGAITAGLLTATTGYAVGSLRGFGAGTTQ